MQKVAKTKEAKVKEMKNTDVMEFDIPEQVRAAVLEKMELIKRTTAELQGQIGLILFGFTSGLNVNVNEFDVSYAPDFTKIVLKVKDDPNSDIQQ